MRLPEHTKNSRQYFASCDVILTARPLRNKVANPHQSVRVHQIPLQLNMCSPEICKCVYLDQFSFRKLKHLKR